MFDSTAAMILDMMHARWYQIMMRDMGSSMAWKQISAAAEGDCFLVLGECFVGAKICTDLG
jgi:hypothetical protein